MFVLESGTRVRRRGNGQEAAVVRRMPENTAPGHEAEEVEPVYELDDGSLAPAGDLEVLGGPDTATEAEAAEPAQE